MAYGWRFFIDTEKQWRWERISVAHGIMHSPKTYGSYEECVNAAAAYGYVYLPSQEKRRAGAPSSAPEHAGRTRGEQGDERVVGILHRGTDFGRGSV